MMLCSKFKQIAIYKSTLHNNVQIRCFITSRDILKKWVWIDGLLTSVTKSEKTTMSPIRIIIKDLRVWSIWTRSSIVGTVIRRCGRDRGVREVIQCFRHAFLRPKRTLLISATAAYKARGDDDENTPSCEKNITDAELQELLKDMDAVEMLSRRTLFCNNCGMRLVIDKKQPGVRYCSCTTTQASENSTDLSDGWVPYMEAEDVIIWRKEYKPGLGLYAYKVYGRYSDVRAADFAAIQVDGAYRRVWDAAVAALAVVERGANGLPDQAVLHWEVLWPRLFANRDYVYIRRHKQFDVVGKSLRHREGLFQAEASTKEPCIPIYTERPSVHSNAKRKALDVNADNEQDTSDNKVYVILNRSCEHPDVPETRHAIRVSEYWSHMVVKTMNGPNKNGMEFVLTYYDEPAVGGMPSGVASWATGRAAPAYLARMRRAATEYRAWRENARQEVPDFTPFGSQEKPIHEEQELLPVTIDQDVAAIPKDQGLVTTCKEDDTASESVTEVHQYTSTEEETGLGFESLQFVTEVELKETETRDQETQTEEVEDKQKDKSKDKNTEDKSVATEREVRHDPVQTDGDPLKVVEEEEPKNGKAEKS